MERGSRSTVVVGDAIVSPNLTRISTRAVPNLMMITDKLAPAIAGEASQSVGDHST